MINMNKHFLMKHVSLLLCFFLIFTIAKPEPVHAFDAGAGDLHSGQPLGDPNPDEEPDKDDDEKCEDPCDRKCTAADPVRLQNGLFTYERSFLLIPGRIP